MNNNEDLYEDEDDDFEQYKLMIDQKEQARMNMHFEKQPKRDKSATRAYVEKKSLENENLSDYEDNKSDKKVQQRSCRRTRDYP